MISIIVSSYNQKYFEALSKNVDETIGLPYEIIQIWNPGTMGICEAYNKGGEVAQYDYLVFCHEDIEFVSLNWGIILQKHFHDDETLGLIGIAGSDYVPNVFIGWQTCLGNHIKMSIIQDTPTERINVCLGRKEIEEVREYVNVLDGCFLCARAEVFKRIKFDSSTLRGFHLYDIDFSLNTSLQYKVAVIYDLKLRHFSLGSYDVTYFKELESFLVKWKSLLPYPTKDIDLYIERMHLKLYLNYLFQNKLSFWLIYNKLLTKRYFKIYGISGNLKNLIILPLIYIKLKYFK